MTQPTDETDGVPDGTNAPDPDADPENLNPRDDRHPEPYTGDPDGDPGNLNPRDTLPGSETSP
ncbi:hypothetical protein [Kineosporia succinea]|uniref:Uncharacterized protein n=1 Tax=Kineosporia succinea TaxID=84632 RepID=A0ABT9PCG7_9ACTN|nr:hypothetical protein [Kineosporia succinea]MDP9830407.1 hypothetical protein [Kineosporia succinea]